VIGPSLALLGIFLLFYLLVGPSFATFFNMQTILRQSTVTCMAALGATFIIISGGIDLSVGSSVALAAMAVAKLLTLGYADPLAGGGEVTYLSLHPVAWPAVCAAAGVGVGLLCGLVNGALVTRLRLAPFIVTLGSMMIFRGATEMISVVAVNADANWVLKLLTVPDLPAWAERSPLRPALQWLFLAPGIWITVAFAAAMAVLLNYFRFGRYTVAVGSNEQTARLCGIPVDRTKVLLYLVGGLFAGLAGVMQYARQRQGSPSATVGLELDVIAACVIGGASLNGGKGSVFGTLVGALIMTVISNGCSQIPIPASFPRWLGEGTGLPSSVQKIVTGLIIVAAVALDNLRHRRPK
jgi:ribose/xylose/arabinose/galactoside ABC-type transport system permease subunit